MFSFSFISYLEIISYCIWGVIVVKLTSYGVKEELKKFPKSNPNELFQTIATYSVITLGTIALCAILSGWTYVLLETDLFEMTIVNATLALPIVLWETRRYLKKVE